MNDLQTPLEGMEFKKPGWGFTVDDIDNAAETIRQEWAETLTAVKERYEKLRNQTTCAACRVGNKRDCVCAIRKDWMRQKFDKIQMRKTLARNDLLAGLKTLRGMMVIPYDPEYVAPPLARMEEKWKAAVNVSPEEKQVVSDRQTLRFAKQVADKLVQHLSPFCEKIEVGGSVRRGAQTVKDVEIVVIPRGDELWRVLDTKVKEGKIEKAVYGRRNGKPIYRWGNKYRGFVWAGMKIEVFAATAENWGYIYLLRTGPGEANTAIMQACKVLQAPFQFKEGYAYRNGKVIPLANEEDVFKLLGLEYVHPAERSEAGYWKEFKKEGHEWG